MLTSDTVLITKMVCMYVCPLHRRRDLELGRLPASDWPGLGASQGARIIALLCHYFKFFMNTSE